MKKLISIYLLYLIILLVSTNLTAQNTITMPNTIEEFNKICRGYKLVDIDKGQVDEMTGKLNQITSLPRIKKYIYKKN